MLPHNFLEKMENSSSIVYIFLICWTNIETGDWKKAFEREKASVWPCDSYHALAVVALLSLPDKPHHILQPLPCSVTLSPAVEVPLQKIEGWSNYHFLPIERLQKKEGRLQKSVVVQEHVLSCSYLSNVLVRHPIQLLVWYLPLHRRGGL